MRGRCFLLLIYHAEVYKIAYTRSLIFIHMYTYVNLATRFHTYTRLLDTVMAQKFLCWQLCCLLLMYIIGNSKKFLR